MEIMYLFPSVTELCEDIIRDGILINVVIQKNDSIHYHGLGEELFLKIIDGLDDVTLAYRGTKKQAILLAVKTISCSFRSTKI